MTDHVPVIEGYEGLREIGRGGAACVYRAFQPKFARQVAIKVLNRQLVESTAADFEQECQTMGALSMHPNIVTVMASEFTEDGRPCIVMDLFPAGDYMSHLRKEGPVALDELLSLGVCIAGALATAHAQDVIHGDIKPQNILKPSFGAPALGDFGIAMINRRESNQPLRGLSIHYAAPEVITGKSQPGPASDQYSLGATIFTLASGHRPFESKFREPASKVIRRVLWDPTPRLPGSYPDEFRDAVYRAMARNPKRRYSDLGTFAMALAEIEYELGYPVTPVPIRQDLGYSANELSPRIENPDTPAGTADGGSDAERPHDSTDTQRTLGESGPPLSTQTLETAGIEAVSGLVGAMRPGMVKALICSGCDSPSPPTADKCRGCGITLSQYNTEHRTIKQPTLGAIRLSGGKVEPLDTNLIIGRNPTHGDAIETHQRAVFLGTSDRRVSRRQVEVTLDGWRPMVLNLSNKATTTIESPTGEVFRLSPGASRHLDDGDAVRFGTASFQYDATTTHAKPEPAPTPTDITRDPALVGAMRPGMVKALICSGCDSPSPPTADKCRGCGITLSQYNTEHRTIKQPTLGAIRLSGGKVELLDTNLIIGRDPTHGAIESDQRPIVHGKNDRSVSRRHLELRRDGWKLIVINFNKGRVTKIRTQSGKQHILPPGIPQELNNGDVVYFGSVWLQYRTIDTLAAGT